MTLSGRNRPIFLRADTGTPQCDPGLIALIADARRWMDDLIDGRATSVAEIAEREQLRPGNASRVLPLAWPAPDIAALILEGRQPAIRRPQSCAVFPAFHSIGGSSVEFLAFLPPESPL